MLIYDSLCGLGKPPRQFTTNNNESLNNVLKRKVDFKKTEWPRFNKILRSFTEEQQTEFEKSIFGEGEYELVDEFKCLEVPHLRLIQMNRDQRKAKIKQAYNAKISTVDQPLQSQLAPTKKFLISKSRMPRLDMLVESVFKTCGRKRKNC